MHGTAPVYIAAGKNNDGQCELHLLLSSAVMILYLPASCALSSISRFHCFSGTRIVIEVSYGSLVLWRPLYFQNCCVPISVCFLLFFGVLSISRFAVHICVCSLCFVAPLYFQNCSVHMYVINVISYCYS